MNAGVLCQKVKTAPEDLVSGEVVFCFRFYLRFQLAQRHQTNK
jgi:hypothetical protein